MKFRRISPWLFAWWVLLAEGVPLMAVTIPVTQVTWSSTATGSDFFAGSNWQGGVAPTSTQTGFFGSSTSGSIIVFGSGTVGGLQFLSSASAFSFTSAPGAALTIGSAGIADYSNLSQSLNISLSFNSGTTLIQNFGTGTLSLGNSGTALSMLSGASLQFTVAGKGSTVLQGSLSGTGTLTKDGSGTLSLYNTSSTFSGPTLVKQGTLSLPFTAAMPSGNVVTVNAQGGEARIDLGGSSQTFGQLTLGGVSTSANSSNVVTLGSSTGYLTIGGTSAGSINYVASSSAATDPAMAIIKEGTVSLANGGTINVANSANAAIDLYVSSALAATGTITKTGAGTLMLAGGGTNLTGNLVASAGTLLVGSVFAGSSGSAVIEVQAGATLAGSWYSPDPTYSSTAMTAGNITVARPVTLRNGSQVGAWSYDQGKLILNGNVLVDTASTVKIGGAGGVQVAGALDATTTNATVSFGNANAQWRSVLGITGTVGTNLSTLSSSGAAVIFSRAPTATSVYAASGGYIGIAPDTATGTAPSFASMAALVGSNKSGFAGTFGFDSAKSGATVTPYADFLDFSGFNTGMTIGSVTRALLSGPITPANPNRYAFGNGGGILAVTSNLGDGASTPRGLSVVSDTAISNNSLGLILRGANSFSGNVTVDNSFLVLDSPFAFPAKAGQGISLTTTTGAYLSATEQSNVSSFRRLMQAVNGNYSPLSILGFDSHGYIDAQILGSYTTSDRTVLEGLNLGAYAPFYLGSATRATLSGTLVAPAAGLLAGNRSLYLAGVGDGRLAVRSYLSNATGVDKVVVGESTGFNNGGTVAIFGRNKYTGGTTLLSGTLEVGAGTRFSAGTLAAGPLGTGSLLVPASALSPALSPLYSSYYAVELANLLQLDSRLDLGARNGYPSPANLLLSGAISGAAGLDIYTNTTLSGANSFSGGVNLYAGSLTLGSNSALGAGDLNVIPEGGYSPSLVVDANRQVSNNLYLTPGSTSYSQLSVSGAGSLELKGTVTLQGAYTLNPSTFPLTLSGTVTGPGVLNVAGYAPLILSGSNSYQGGTTSSGGAAVFGSVASIPANGNLLSYYGGYIGLASTNFGGSGTYQSSFIDRFDKSSSTGAIGFDSLPNAQGQLTVNNFTGPVDLTGFTNPMRLGSATSAILSGPIVPQGNVYRFGGGGGKLEVTSGLTDGTNARSLELLTQMSGSLTLRLPGGSSAANTFSGGVTVKNAALVFGGGAGAMPSSGTFGLESFGYVGTEDTSLYGANLGAYLSRLNVGAGGAVVGFDLPSGGALTPVSGTVDLGRITIASAVATAANKDPAIFLGTTSKAEITGSIILPANQSVLRFTGYKGGELTVSSALSGAVGVQIGDQSSAASVTDPLNATGPMSTVILKGNNTYTGDTVLYAGQLVIGSNSALGTGQLKVSYGPYVPALNGNSSLLAATAAPSGSQWVVSNAVALDYAPLRLGGTNPFTLSGVISSLGAGISKTGTSVVTLTGANTFSGETIIEQGTLVFGSSQAAGGGGLALIGSGSPVAQFTAGSSILSGGLRGSGGLVQLAPSSSLLIIQGNDAEFAGAFGVNGSAGSTANLRFQGPGYNPPTLALSGASTTFAGTATIEAGGKVLIANPAALGTSSIMISGGKLLVDHELTSANPLTNPIAFNQTNGGSLGGNGTIERATTLRVGIMASLDPGSDLPGILSFKAGNGLSGPVLTLATGGALKIKLSDALDPLGGWDRINVAGVTSFDVPSGLFTVKLSFSGATDFAGLVNFDPTQVYNWPIISATSITGFSPNSIFIDLGSATLPTGASLFTSLNSAGDTLLLNYSPVAVPEPSTWALMLSGAAFLGFKLRRRRS